MTQDRRIHTVCFGEPLLQRLSDYIVERYLGATNDLSRLAIVFGGKRPAMFLKRELARRVGHPFISPSIFTIDDFMAHIAGGESGRLSDMDECFWMYEIAARHAPGLLKGRVSFAEFLPWAREMTRFIDQLDLEAVDDDALLMIKQNAQIGYEVPDDINELLRHIAVIRGHYHDRMRAEGVASRGFRYRQAAEAVGCADLGAFDEIIFANFFYLNRSEMSVVESLYRSGKARLFFQGDERRWPVLKRTAQRLGASISEGGAVGASPGFDLTLHAAFDGHAQVAIVRSILEQLGGEWEKTVVVLPNADYMIPLISAIGPSVREFNISMGYPLRRSSLAGLFEIIVQAQGSRKEGRYYTQDYLRVMRHPLIKNLDAGGGGQVVRVLIHKLEEICTGQIEGPWSGCVFLDLDDIEASEELYRAVEGTLEVMGMPIQRSEIAEALRSIHIMCLRHWEDLGTFAGFSRMLAGFMDMLMEKSALLSYPLNGRIASRIYDLADELSGADFSAERFPDRDIFRIFLAQLEREIVAFHGSPLKGLQVLGLFETRSLDFDHVIIMDVNEGVLPRLNLSEALIPRDVMISLNLDRVEQEEEIQRYGFMRLISSAKDVHLVYQEGPEHQRSRFVEELVWRREQAAGRIRVVEPDRPYFRVSPQIAPAEIRKTPDMISFLKAYRYSASSINMYLRNPMEFYYNHVLGLRPQEDMLDEPENRHIGNLVHEVLEESFRGFCGRAPLFDDDFRARFKMILERRYHHTFGRSRRPDAFLMKAVIEERLQRFIEYERTRPVVEVLYVEEPFEEAVPLACGPVRFVYKVDRVDRMADGTILVLDYKTGSTDLLPRSLNEITAAGTDRQAVYEAVHSFQLPLYLHYVHHHFPGAKVDAGLYNIRTLEIKRLRGPDDPVSVEDRDQAFLTSLGGILAEIFDPEVPFVDTEAAR